MNHGESLALDKPLRKLLRYSRLSVLAMLNATKEDGLTYNSLKDSSGLSEGTIGPTLKWLNDNGYIETKEAVEKVYTIKQKGEDDFKAFNAWLGKVGGENK